MKDNYYVASANETLKDIAVKTGVGYTRLLKYNPEYTNGVPKGAQVVLSLDKIDEEKSEKENSKKKQEDKTTQDKTNATTNVQPDTSKEEKQNTYDIEKYVADMQELNASFSQKQKKLADSIKKTRAKSEGDFAKQKIAVSSIAKNERDRQAKEFSAQREDLEKDYNDKALKLNKTLEAIKNKK